MSPKLYLVVDNCFASKRWTHPSEWMSIVRDCGAYYVEASADNESDPLYSTPEVLQRWREAALKASQQTGVKVANFYSGHGTYTTLGLSHHDERIRDHIQHNWLEPMLDSAAALGASLGFYTHAFSQAVLRHADQYAAVKADLYRRLAEVAQYANDKGVTTAGVEQMYSPHQAPWTIEGTHELLREVHQQAQVPFYTTLDVGHMAGQRHFQKPTREQVEAHLNGKNPDLWIGLIDEPGSVDEVMDYIDAHPYLYAQAQDGDMDMWIRDLSIYSPIIHLQQTDGSSSRHLPFTEANNANGIVHGEHLLKTIAESYASAARIEGLPPVENLYFTIEVFSGTAQPYSQIIKMICESVQYWRQFIPEDGITLDEAIARL